MADFPVTLHDKPYPAIDPLRPELSQAGRTVLVSGASTGIGFAIARNFCKAGAATVILLGRRPDVLASSVSTLKDAFPQIDVVGIPYDAFDRQEIDRVWDGFRSEGKPTVSVDVLVLNAVGVPALQPILDQGVDRLWEDYEKNVRAQLYTVERFWKQQGHDKQKMPGYQLTKNACTAVLQQIARDTPAEKMQVVSFHPSLVLTEAARAVGMDENTLPWTDENVPGQFAVWLASAEAKYLHGRFVWANWDVEELSTGNVRKTIDSDPWYLKVGVKGL